MWPTLSHTQHPGMLHRNYSRSCLLRHASQTELLHSAEQLVLPSISSSNTCRWRNILGVCWPKELQQWHNQSARGACFMVCALFSLLSTDYGNLLTGFRVPIQQHNSLLLHSLDPEMSLFRVSCERWKGYCSGGSAPLPAAVFHITVLQQESFLQSESWSSGHKKISALEDKHWCSSWKIPGQASQRGIATCSVRTRGK